MSIAPIDPHEEVVVPVTGEIVSLTDRNGVAKAIEDVRDIESKLRELKGTLTHALAAIATREGTKTLELGDGRKAVLSGGRVFEYDAELMENELRIAGMSESRIAEIVVPTVSYRVSAVEAKKAAAANPVYSDIVESCRREVETPVRVSLRRS